MLPLGSNTYLGVERVEADIVISYTNLPNYSWISWINKAIHHFMWEYYSREMHTSYRFTP